jgi:hypothetical protein
VDVLSMRRYKESDRELDSPGTEKHQICSMSGDEVVLVLNSAEFRLPIESVEHILVVLCASEVKRKWRHESLGTLHRILDMSASFWHA